MNASRVAIAATALVVCLGIAGLVGNLASAQYPALQGKGERGMPGDYRTSPDREQKLRERSPPPRPIVPPEGQQLNPALREECAWIGQRIVGLLFRDDPVTGTDFLPFYTRFGCPEDYLHQAFACVVKDGDLENEVLADRIAQCWTDPAQQSLPSHGGEKGSSDQTPRASAPPSPTKPANGGPK